MPPSVNQEINIVDYIINKLTVKLILLLTSLIIWCIILTIEGMNSSKQKRRYPNE